MNVLFITIAWPLAGERNLYSDLMNEFVRQGHSVFVAHADDEVKKTQLSVEGEISVLRIASSPMRKMNKFRKAVALVSLGKRIESAIDNQWTTTGFDLIISHSPPITLSRMFKSLKRKLGSPVYYLLKDIWPQGPADLGFIKDGGVIYNFFRFQEKRLYRTVDHIGCMSPLNVEYLLKNNAFLSRTKVEVCPNTISPRNLTMNEEIASVRNRFDIPEDAVVFIFSGNIGRAHGLEFYLNAIERSKSIDKAFFMIGGSGQYFDYVVQEIEKRGIENLRYYRRLPADEFDSLLMASDVGVVLLDARYTVPQFPSRLLAYLEARKPVLCAVNAQTDIGTIVEKSGCGLNTLHGDVAAFEKAVNFFCDTRNSEMIEEMKQNSHDLLLREFSSQRSYEIIMNRLADQPYEKI